MKPNFFDETAEEPFVRIGTVRKLMNRATYIRSSDPGDESPCPIDETALREDVQLWSTPNGTIYYPVAHTMEILPPDVYEIVNSQQGPIFQRINFSTESFIRFNDSIVDQIVSEVQTFWAKKPMFDEYDLPFRRGILLFGPAGAGKSVTVKIVVSDVIKQGGIAIKYGHSRTFVEGMRMLRKIQPDTPVVVIMEDIEAILECNSRSDVLNTLDGVDSFEQVVYIATTNYPEALEPRIKNRPSRFDRRHEIGNPKPNVRKQYLEFLLSKSDRVKIDIEKWVKDTDKMSIAHIKELFISVNVFGYEYDTAIKDLHEMSKKISSEDPEARAGFALREPY